jgi:tetratricopeptide (TPR) repeat protein
MTLDKIKFTYENESLTVNVDKLLLNEMFKTALPLEELNLKLTAQGEDLLKLQSSLNVEYGIKVCGNEFQPTQEKELLVFARTDRQFSFKMTPKPVMDLGKVIFAKESTLDDLFFYEVHGRKQIGSDFISPQEMLADLCYQQTFARLQPSQAEALKPLVKVLETPPSSVELIQEVTREAQNFLRLGKYTEAKSLLEAIQISSTPLSAVVLGAFYNVKAWAYLKSGDPQEASQAFEMAFAARKDISDAEGMWRANEALKKDQEALKWLDYIKMTLQTNPELSGHLTPNLKKKIVEETSSH